MAYTTASVYSKIGVDIDPSLYICDVDFNHKNIYETHQNYINNNQRSQAANYINGQEGITPITADLFNLWANRIVALQTVLEDADSVERPYYSSVEPISPKHNAVWIE